MEVQNSTKDRYISFCDIECDKNADKLIAMLDGHLEAGSGSEQWRVYFSKKRAEQKQMGRDNLNLIGNQINPLYEYFDECDDEAAQDLLYQLEQECC
ncbi:N(2)-fixation sustaining protein CowN [Reinekea marinisedimentorum]|uniref:N(2)-fixation sustaining protein CowN n=1 Tax=Reinekea marinisedimentorum TaxID=230495 RepID=A0A4R3I110_9GAMM|nr:N(2)-fixation sustaining protein CowN [Reinekea marinisedimentorum]TCS38874.1 hypothetical protein BCF53_11439 [Reinekea marinisedimentorum]